MAGMKTRIAFMGTPDFALPSLRELEKNFDLTAVITQPDRRAGRGRKLTPPPVKRTAQSLDVAIYQPESLDEFEIQTILSDMDLDLIVVAAFGQILPREVLAIPRKGCLNVHASLLPRWRGASPINAAILHGDRESGVTIMKMDAGLDTGPILKQRKTIIRPDDTAGSLFNRLSRMGAEVLVEAIPPYLTGKLQPRSQDESLATYAPQLSREDGELDFSRRSDYLARQVRAFYPWPGSFTSWQGKRLIIHRAESADVTTPGVGEFTTYEDYPAVGTAEGLLVFLKVQPAGKKAMAGDAFLRGAQEWGNSP